MLTLEQIRAMLRDRNLSRVSEATGISVSYLSMLRQGSRVNPSYQTIDALSRYLEGAGICRMTEKEGPDGRYQ